MYGSEFYRMYPTQEERTKAIKDRHEAEAKKEYVKKYKKATKKSLVTVINENCFYQLYLKNKLTIKDIRQYIGKWENGNKTQTVYEFLGLPLNLYYSWRGCGLLD